MSRKQEKASPIRPPRDLTVIFDRNEVKDTYRISYLANSLVLPVYDRIKREHGLNRGEYLLLFCLAHMEELTAQDVANMTGRPRNSISRAVHRMLRDGYLDRVPDESDGRQALLTITEKGQKLHQRIVKIFAAREEVVLSALTEGEHQAFNRILQSWCTTRRHCRIFNDRKVEPTCGSPMTLTLPKPAELCASLQFLDVVCLPYAYPDLRL